MKHGILAHEQITETGTPQVLYTFTGAATYQLHAEAGVSLLINAKPLLNPDRKHLANTADVISVSGNGWVLLEGVEA